MLLFIFATLCILLATVAALLRPIYGSVSLHELKRRSTRGDGTAHVLYQVARHGVTADAFLLLITIVCLALAVVVIVQQMFWLWASIVVGLLVWSSLVYLPSHETKIGRRLAIRLSPYVAQILIKIRPATNAIARVFRRKHNDTQSIDTIYEKEDLINLLENQKKSSHNRIEKTELDLAVHALSFGEKKVEDFMIPRRVVRFVHAEEPVGPVLLSELHDSGFSRFPVRKDEDQIVGTLYLKDLVEKRVQGIVSNVMSPDVYYVRGDAQLEQVLAAFLKTKHHLFMVVNEFEEIVGIITIEDVLEQVLGRKIVDEFDQYDDMRAVARDQAQAEDHPKAAE